MTNLPHKLISLLLLFSLSKQNAIPLEVDNILGGSIIDTLREPIQEIISFSLNKTKLKLPVCYSLIENNYLSNTSEKELLDYNYKKLLYDSSREKNRLDSYDDCMKTTNNNETSKKSTYLVVIFRDQYTQGKKTYDLKYSDKFFELGLCLTSEILKCPKQELEIFFSSTFNEFFNLSSKVEIDEYPMSLYDHREPLNFKYFISYLPFLIILIQVIIIIFELIPFKFFKGLFISGKTISDVVNEVDNIAQKDKLLYYGKSVIVRKESQFKRLKFDLFKNLLSVGSSIDELFSNAIHTNINNDTGLLYIRGIKGCAIITMFFGAIYFVLFNYPLSYIEEKSFTRILKHGVYSLFYIGLRYSPRVALSCSGSSLGYKLLCYLDERTEEHIERKACKKQIKSKLRDTIHKKTEYVNHVLAEEEEEEDDDYVDPNSNDYLLRKNVDDDPEGKRRDEDEKSIKAEFFDVKRKKKDVRFGYLGIFYFNQIHKYIIYILVLLFTRFTLFKFIKVLLTNKSGPTWEYLNKYVIDLNHKSEILKGMFLLLGLGLKTESYENFMNFYWLLINEMLLFIIFSFIIFMGYKMKNKVNHFLIFLIFVSIIVKIILASVKDNFGESLYFNSRYTYWIHTIYWNYSYYIIGIFFGFMNYCYQKNITFKEIINQDKFFLNTSYRLLRSIKRKSMNFTYTFGFILIFLILIFCFNQSIILNINPSILNNFMSKYITSKGLKIFLTLDKGIFVFLIHLLGITFGVKGKNFMNNFFSSSKWSVLNKLYFSIILSLYPTCLFIVYQTDSRFDLTLSNMFTYSFIGGSFTFLFAYLNYIFFELPWKRIVKTISMKIRNNQHDLDDLNKVISLAYKDNLDGEEKIEDNKLYSNSGRNTLIKSQYI